MEAYNNFAKIYDTLMDDVDYNGWYRYIKGILEKYKHTPQTVLEMACGTGNLTKFLCAEDYDITCFDLSEEMLSAAYDKLRNYRNCKILNQDMVNFSLNKRYDLILSICDSINYITEKSDLEKVFQKVFSHLEDDGIFIFDVNSYYKLSSIIGNNTFVEDRQSIFYVWENQFDYENSLCEFYLTFFVERDGSYLRFNESHLQKAYRIDEIVTALKNSQLEVIDVFESFSFNKPTEKSERINFIVRKI